MDLNLLWFILIAVLFTGFFFLEGFDYGVGMLLPFMSREDRARRAVINTIGPVWDGNEVWMVTAGGALFAAFPRWYAALFSGLYIPLTLLLLALIARGVSFEFRSKHPDPRWRGLWDRAIFFGSLVPALLWGVAISSWARGLPLDAAGHPTTALLPLLDPFALLGGVTATLVFALHGALFLGLKLGGALSTRARALAWRLWPFALAAALSYAISAYFQVPARALAGLAWGLSGGALLALAGVGVAIKRARDGWAFILTALTIVAATAAFFASLFPLALPSTISPAHHLDIYNAAASAHTLTVMSWVALVLVPVVLVYQSWTYWVFRQRLTADSELEY